PVELETPFARQRDRLIGSQRDWHLNKANEHQHRRGSAREVTQGKRVSSHRNALTGYDEKNDDEQDDRDTKDVNDRRSPHIQFVANGQWFRLRQRLEQRNYCHGHEQERERPEHAMQIRNLVILPLKQA